ncbi:hypothetical protein ACQ4PT_042374 [Festuca glaucescens]
MGDRGGRNPPGVRRGRGAVGGAGGRNPNTGRGGGGNRNIVWLRDEGIGGGNAGASGSTVRWDEAAAAAQARQVKHRASSLVITVLEGNPTSRDLEKEFNEYLGSGWRCTARPINPNQYTMRFPSPKEVDKAVFYGKSMEIKTFNDVINLSPWSEAIGASGMLNKAWVRVRNIPPEKRCDAHAAYAGSLVGVTLEVDQATLHKPEYCRILLGCKDIDNIAETAEGVLGDFFYIFSYEVESIVAQGPPVVRNVVMVANSSAPPSPKRARTETYSTASAASTDGFAGATNQSGGAGYGRNCAQTLAAVSKHDSEEESENDSELLIDTIARENRFKHDKVATELSDSANASYEPTAVEVVNPIHNANKVVAPITPWWIRKCFSPDSAKTDRKMVISYDAAVIGPVWSASPVVTEIENEEPVGDEGRAEYFVQSPNVAVTEE